MLSGETPGYIPVRSRGSSYEQKEFGMYLNSNWNIEVEGRPDEARSSRHKNYGMHIKLSKSEKTAKINNLIREIHKTKITEFSSTT